MDVSRADRLPVQEPALAHESGQLGRKLSTVNEGAIHDRLPNDNSPIDGFRFDLEGCYSRETRRRAMNISLPAGSFWRRRHSRTARRRHTRSIPIEIGNSGVTASNRSSSAVKEFLRPRRLRSCIAGHREIARVQRRQRR